MVYITFERLFLFLGVIDMNFDKSIGKDGKSLVGDLGGVLVGLGGVALGIYTSMKTDGFKFVHDLVAQIGIKSDLLNKAITIGVAGFCAGITTRIGSKMSNKYIRMGFSFLSIFLWTMTIILAVKTLMTLTGIGK